MAATGGRLAGWRGGSQRRSALRHASCRGASWRDGRRAIAGAIDVVGNLARRPKTHPAQPPASSGVDDGANYVRGSSAIAHFGHVFDDARRARGVVLSCRVQSAVAAASVDHRVESPRRRRARCAVAGLVAPVRLRGVVEPGLAGACIGQVHAVRVLPQKPMRQRRALQVLPCVRPRGAAAAPPCEENVDEGEAGRLGLRLAGQLLLDASVRDVADLQQRSVGCQQPLPVGVGEPRCV
mmetsp:Transcript_70151/g.203408  ORF Transcript_70151/g.203408 Transcript_70151/m.203408 type:complete len:238 (-) Transcript_70151:80-793(-)